jgi:hypothetical protein
VGTPDDGMVEVPTSRLQQMRDRIAELEGGIDLARQTIRQLQDEANQNENFVVACTELIPEGYDSDEAAESIILRYLKDMDTFAGIIARLTSAYR